MKEREPKRKNGSNKMTKEKCDEIHERKRATRGRIGENVKLQERVEGQESVKKRIRRGG